MLSFYQFYKCVHRLTSWVGKPVSHIQCVSAFYLASDGFLNWYRSKMPSARVRVEMYYITEIPVCGTIPA